MKESHVAGASGVLLAVLLASAFSGGQQSNITKVWKELDLAELQYTGLMGCYTQAFTGNYTPTADSWHASEDYWIHKLTFWRDRGYRYARLMFKFVADSSTIPIMNYDVLDDVLTIFDGIGVKVILDLHNLNGATMQPDNASISANWLALATRYLDDTRIAAFNLFNEVGLNPSSPTSSDAVITAFYATLTEAIHAIDPDRVVIFPCGMHYYDNAAAWIAGVAASGVLTHASTTSTNLIFDVVHPYWFLTTATHTDDPASEAAYYRTTWVDPCVAAWGANRCWCGETFCFPGGGASTATGQQIQDQITFLTEMINHFVYAEVPFQIGTLWGTTTYNEQAMTLSIYGDPDPPPENPSDTLYIGPSSYPRTIAGSYSTAIIDDVIAMMDSEGLNVYRMSIYYNVATATRDAMIQHFIDNCDYTLIVCRHVYDPGGGLPSGDSWANVRAWALDVCSKYSSSRVMVEPVNEYGSSDLGAQMQTLVTAVRAAGYAHGIVFNKWNQAWSTVSITDTLDSTYVGYHFYFNGWSVSSAIAQMQTALNLGLKLINTEIGADFNEASQFDYSEVQEVNDFMDWCAERGIGNCVWMRYGLQNYGTYLNLGLTFPPLPETPVPPPPATYTLTVQTATGGTTDPTGVIGNIAGGTVINVHATPSSDYAFQEWLLDGQKYSSLLVVGVTMNANHTLTPIFQQVPTVTQYNLTVQQSVGGHTSPVAGTYVFDAGYVCTVTAIAEDGYEFDFWMVNNVNSGSANPINVTMSSDNVVRAFFVWVVSSPPEENPEEEPEPVQGPVSVPKGNVPASEFSALIGTVASHLANAPAPDFAKVVSVLEGVEPESFSQIVEAFKKVNL